MRAKRLKHDESWITRHNFILRNDMILQLLRGGTVAKEGDYWFGKCQCEECIRHAYAVDPGSIIPPKSSWTGVYARLVDYLFRPVF